MDIRSLSFENAYIDSTDKIWFSSMYFNSLFCYDLNSEEIEWKGCFPKERVNGRWLYNAITPDEDGLYFIPYVANDICYYDLKTREFSKIQINSDNIAYQKYFASANWGESIYLFGALTCKVACLNKKNKTIEYDDALYKELEKFDVEKKGWWINRNTVIIDHYCYLSSRRCNVIVEYNLNDRSYKCYKINNVVGGVTTICKLKDNIIIITLNGDIIAWDYKTHEEKIYTNYSEKTMNAWSYYIYEFDKLIMFPMKGLETVEIMESKHICQKAEKQYEYCDRNMSEDEIRQYDDQKISWAGESSFGKAYFSNMNRILYYEKNGRWHKKSLIVPDDVYERICSESSFGDNQKIIYENEIGNLSRYIEWLKAHKI